MHRSLRIVFFGTPVFAVPSLDALLASRHSVVAVVTQPDRPRGRGQKTTDAPVKARALEKALPVFQPGTLKDAAFLSAFSDLDSDLGVVAAYGKILTDAVLQTPREGMVNVHASLLPKYRGAAPIHRAVIAGEHETGITIMRVVKALDAGPMLATARRPIAVDETSEAVEHDLARIGATLLVSTIDALANGRVDETPQDESATTYAARLTKADGEVDWSGPSVGIHNLIRGLHPWPHAYTFANGRRIILLRASPVVDGLSGTIGPPGAPRQASAGEILVASGDDLVVATGDGALRIVELQVEGKRPMGVRDFLAGHPLRSGDRFTTAD
jgi:methionyl-tRNA formyltransferase